MTSQSWDGFGLPLSENMRKDVLYCNEGKFPLHNRNIKTQIMTPHISNFYYELEAQYLKFIELTQGQGNSKHLDFHCYKNLQLPVSFALRKLIKKYDIRTVRLTSTFDKNNRFTHKLMKKACCFISKSNGAKTIPSCKILEFIRYSEFCKQEVFELFTHPDLVENDVVDYSKTAFDDPQNLLESNIEKINNLDNYEFISWNDFDNSLK